jgi:hypothetical protein
MPVVAPVLGNFRIDKFLPVRPEVRKRAFLVDSHASAIADHVVGAAQDPPQTIVKA